MRCLYPYIRHIEKYNKDVAIPCGRCIACRVNKTREWTQRLVDERDHAKSAYFVTLTYNEDTVPYDQYGNPCVNKDDVKLFLRRLKYMYPEVRYFLCSEYGELGRPHYHAILYNVGDDILEPSKDFIPGMPLRFIKNGNESYINRKLNDIWKLGFCTIGEPVRHRLSYCAKYFVSKQEVQDKVPNFALMSTHNGGIGFSRVEQSGPTIRKMSNFGLRTDLGTFVKLPRYYDKKIFSDEERIERWTSKSEQILKDLEKRDGLVSIRTDAHGQRYIPITDSIRSRADIAKRNYNQTHKKDTI